MRNNNTIFQQICSIRIILVSFNRFEKYELIWIISPSRGEHLKNMFETTSTSTFKLFAKLFLKGLNSPSLRVCFIGTPTGRCWACIVPYLIHTGGFFWFPLLNLNLVVSTHLKNISQNGNLLQIGVKIKKKHHLVKTGHFETPTS